MLLGAGEKERPGIPAYPIKRVGLPVPSQGQAVRTCAVSFWAREVLADSGTMGIGSSCLVAAPGLRQDPAGKIHFC